MQEKEQLVSFVSGIASGTTKLVVGHPFDTIKVRVQTSSIGPLECLKQTIKKEGFFALYKGATPPLLGWTLMDSTQMGSLHFFKTFFDKPLSTRDHAIAGMGAGIVVSFVATPIELLKAKLQVQYQSKVFSGPVDCARHLIKTNGILGLWQGLGACICFRSFFWVLWGSYDIYTRALDGLVPSESIPFLAGGLAANTFWTISFPFDQIKNTIMCQQPDKIQSIISTAKQTFSQFGVRGFYRGFVPCFLRSFPTNGAAIFVMEHTQQFLNGL